MGNVYTLEGSGTTGALTNGETYEKQMYVSNQGELDAPQAGPYSAMIQFTPNSNPEEPSSVTTATAFNSSGAIDPTYPVTLNANWNVGDATGVVSAAIMIEEFKGGLLVPAHSVTQAISSTDFAALMLAAGTDTALPSMPVPSTFFSADNSINVRLRMKVTKDDGTIKMGNRTADIDIYKTILPTMSDLTIRQSTAAVEGGAAATHGVNAGGDQVIVGTFTSSGPGAIAHKQTILDSAADQVATLVDGAYQITAAYNDILAATSKAVSIKIELTDPNATEVGGNVVKYVVEQSISLKAFKLPENVTINATAGACDAPPSYDYELGAAHGNTISGYTVTAEFQGASVTTALDADGAAIVFSSPNPYEVTNTFVEATALANAHGADDSVTLATSNTGSSYIPGPYKIKIVTNFTADLTTAEALQYANTYAMSLSADSGSVNFFSQPTLTSVSSFGANLTVVGNSQGANMTGATAVSAVTFSGATAGEYSMQTSSAASGVAETGNTAPTTLAEKYAFTKVFTFGANIADLSNINLDGIVLLDASNAPSTMRMLNFVDNSVALAAATAAQTYNTAMLSTNANHATLTTAATNAATALIAANAANAAPQAALNSANTAATNATAAAAAALTANDAAAATAAAASTANDAAGDAVSAAGVALNGQAQILDNEGAETQAAVVGAGPAYTAAATAATTAQNDYNTALTAYNGNINATTAATLVAADSNLIAADTAAATALAAKNSAQAALDAANVVKDGQADPYVQGTAPALTAANTAAADAATALVAANNAKQLALAAAHQAGLAAVAPAATAAAALTAKNTADAALAAHPGLTADNDALDAAAHTAAVAAAGIQTSVFSQ